MSTKEGREPMEEDELAINDLEEYYRVKGNMIIRMESLPVSRLTPNLKGELTED